MKHTVLLLYAACLAGLCAGAVPTDRISALRDRLSATGAELTDSDRATIDDFWRTALDTMLLSDGSAQIVTIRRQIQQQKGSEPLSFFATGYVQVGRGHLETAFESVAQWEASSRKALMQRNLMILTAQLESPLLATFGLERLADPDDVVRYWAVRAVTAPGIVTQITDPAISDEVLKERILEALAERVEDEPSLDILRNIVAFSAMISHDTSRQILLDAMQRRVEAYKSWQVDNETFDAILLRYVGQLVLNEPQGQTRTALARGFAELLAMVFQRYMYEPSPLTDEQRSALVGVIAEVDSQILNRVMGQQTPFIRILQRGGDGMDREYQAYFGSEVGPGHLATRLNFNYGRTDAGQPINSPPRLPAPPER